MARGTKHAREMVREKATIPGPAPRHDRRRELIEIAGRLFAERGFLATTIRDVADVAGIQSGSLYHHFDSKESMADELLREYWSTLLERLEAVTSTGAGATEQARQMIRESFLLIESCELAVRMTTNDWNYLAQIFPFMEESLDRCEAIWIKTLEQGIATGEFNSEVSPSLVYRTIMAAISGTARWYRPGGPLRIERLADEMARLFLHGFAARS